LHAAGWSSVPLRLNFGVPVIAAAFNGRDGSFIADLGSDDSMLYPSTSLGFTSPHRPAVTMEIRCSRLPASRLRSNISS
jgi:hypothetical protein